MLSDFLKRLGERRDGFLVVGAYVYGLGYVVWSYNAWRNQLGQLPALDFQYFMSGLLPAALIAGAVFVAKQFPELQLRIRRTTPVHPLWGKAMWVVWVLIGAYPLLELLARKTGLINNPWKISSPLQGLLSTVSFLVFMLITNKVLPGIMWPIWRWWTAASAYTNLPQVLGGPAPRCAYLDLVRAEIAPSSLQVLLPSASLEENESDAKKVVRSARLLVYFSSSDYLLVRPAGEADTENKPKDAPIYELRKEVIRVIEWCAE